MSGVLNTGLDFVQFILTLIVLIIGIVSIRITFNLNKFLEGRKRSYISKLRNACPHMRIVNDIEYGYGFQSYFSSPSGTSQWRCERCGLIRDQHPENLESQADYYLNNLDEFIKADKRFKKLLKKAGMV